VDAYLGSAEESWLKELATKATVHRYEFGDKVLPIVPAQCESNGSADAREEALSANTRLGRPCRKSCSRTLPTARGGDFDHGRRSKRGSRIRGRLRPPWPGTTLHIVPIGNTKMERDVILHHTHAPKAVLQNDTVVVESVLTAYGCEKEALQVQLLEKDTVVEQQTLNVTGEVFDTRVQLRWKAAVLGKHKLTVRVAPLKDERTEENNSGSVEVQVMEEKMRVLVADNFPRWETRYLLNLFKRDDRVAFDQLLFEPQRFSGAGIRSGFPTAPEEWSKFRVVILGDVLPSQLTLEYQKLLRDYVAEAGGNLIIVAGQDAMPAAYANQPLSALLPVLPGGRAGNDPYFLHVADEASDNLAVQIAEDPAGSERVWREMSERMPIYGLSEYSKAKPATHSLIWAGKGRKNFDPGDPSTRSFLTWHYVGAGRVVYLAAPLTYQLRYRQGDAFHHRFWGQLLRWAVARDLAEGSETVRFSTDKLSYEIGEPVQVMAQLRQLDGKVVSGAELQVEAWQGDRMIHGVALKEDVSRPGSYHALLPDSPTGVVRLVLLGDRVTDLLAMEKYTRPIETTITIQPNAMLELRNPLCNLSLLREIADGSGGLVVPPTGLQAAMEQLDLEPETTEIVTKKTLWNRWDLFYLFIGCLSLEWAGRKYLRLS
jgi:hypothetical protein